MLCANAEQRASYLSSSYVRSGSWHVQNRFPSGTSTSGNVAEPRGGGKSGLKSETRSRLLHYTIRLVNWLECGLWIRT